MPSHLPVRPGLAPREHQATRLVALSFDSAASPTFRLGGFDRCAEGRAYGWGFAWYPEQSGSALVVKDATSLGENAMTKLLQEWERFESTTFIAHLRGAARALQEQDTHPFGRAHGGRDWVFAHNGDLDPPDGQTLADALPLGEFPVYEPIGRTDSERAFCYLLTEARNIMARTLAEVGFEQLHRWFRTLDQLGTANFLLSDGRDLAVYADEDGYNAVHHARFVPPWVPRDLRTAELSVGLEDARDRTRTVALFSTLPLAETGFSPMKPGQLMVVRRGAVIYDSHADPEARRRMVPPLVRSSDRASAPSGTQRPAAVQTQAHSHTPNNPQSQRIVPPQDAPGFDPVSPPAVEHRADVDAPAESQTSYAPQDGVDAGATANQQAGGRHASPSGSTGAVRRLSVPRLHHHAQRSEGRLLSVEHSTTYRYRAPVEKSFHLFRLEPVHDRGQDLLDHDLEISVDGLLRRYEDVFGNEVVRADIERPYTELKVRSRSLVRVRADVPDDLHSPSRRFQIPLVWMPWQRQMMTPYLLPPELPETQLRELSDFAMSFVERQDFDLVQTLLDMNISIYRDFSYVSGSTHVATTPFEVFVSRDGVCQDFANLFICLARLLNIPARYRVGYIYTGRDYDNQIQSDASHAWAELYLPWTGWQGFDPTNGVLVNVDHIRVACGRNYGDATPTSGTLYKGGGDETLLVEVKVDEAEPA